MRGSAFGWRHGESERARAVHRFLPRRRAPRTLTGSARHAPLLQCVHCDALQFSAAATAEAWGAAGASAQSEWCAARVRACAVCCSRRARYRVASAFMRVLMMCVKGFAVCARCQGPTSHSLGAASAFFVCAARERATSVRPQCIARRSHSRYTVRSSAATQRACDRESARSVGVRAQDGNAQLSLQRAAGLAAACARKHTEHNAEEDI